MTAREAPRVAFSELIERGMIIPGTKLVDARKRHGALVRAMTHISYSTTTA